MYICSMQIAGPNNTGQIRCRYAVSNFDSQIRRLATTKKHAKVQDFYQDLLFSAYFPLNLGSSSISSDKRCLIAKLVLGHPDI